MNRKNVQTSVQIWKWKWMDIKMVRLMRNMLEIQKGVDMKKWKYSERRYEFGCEDDLIHETRKG